MALALSRDPAAAERPWQPSTAAVAQAGREGWDELAWDLAGSLAGFLAMRSYFDDLRQTHERALGAVTKAGNRRGRAYMLRGLGHLAMELVRHDEATACIDRALHAIAAVRIAAGDHARARPELERSRAIFARGRRPPGRGPRAVQVRGARPVAGELERAEAAYGRRWPSTSGTATGRARP